jgi:hypothetical protein
VRPSGWRFQWRTRRRRRDLGPEIREIVDAARGYPLVQTLVSRRNRQENPPMKTLMFLAALFVSSSLLVPTISVAQPLFC